MASKEAYLGVKLDVIHFQIFGCLVYCHVSLNKRTKLYPTVEKGILTSYSETSKAYTIYILALKRVVVCTNVQFEELWALRRLRYEPDCIKD